MPAKVRKKSGKPAAKRVLSEAGKAAQEANQVTWLLLGNLKNIRKMYLTICIQLARVRDEKLYAALHYPDMEQYARDRLNLGRSSATLQQKAISGKLIRTEVRKLRKPPKTEQNSLKSVISKLRLIRGRAAELANMPPEAIQHVDAAIQILVNESALKVAGLDSLNLGNQIWREKYIA